MLITLAAAGAFLGGLLSETLNDVAKDTIRGGVQQGFKALKKALTDQALPVNHDIQKAIRRSQLLAVQEATRWGRRRWSLTPDNEDDFWRADAAYRCLNDYLDNQLHLLVKSGPLPNVDVDPVTLDPTEADEQRQANVHQHILDTVITELTIYLNNLPVQHSLPTELYQAITNGWNDEQGRFWTLFSLMCDFFQEEIKTNARVRDTIQTQWLADVKVHLESLEKRLAQFGNQFVATFGIVPTYLSELLENTNPQPILRARFKPVKEQPFTFRARSVPFLGREEEWQRLRDFCRDPSFLSWCLVTGAGGSGKSRLALELCLEQTSQYTLYAGFLSTTQLSTLEDAYWLHWKPTCPTLIVIDYAGLAHRRVTTMLKLLNERAEENKLPFSVKLLLLERDTHESWYASVQRVIDLGDVPPPFSGTPINLNALAPQALWKTVQYMVKIHQRQPVTLPDPSVVMSRLMSIDALGRPLFAVFVGYALAEGVDMSAWDKVHLLDYLLNRHIEHIWLPAAGGDAQKLHVHLNLLSVVTMVSGLTQDQLYSLLDKCYAWLPGDAFDEELWHMISPRPLDKPLYAPLEPDLFGEYFVLKQLRKTAINPRLDRQKAEQSLKEAWQINYAQTAFFTYRLFQDFCHLPFTDDEAKDTGLMPLQFFVKFPTDTVVNNSILTEQAEVLFGTTSSCAEVREFATAQQLYDMLTEFVIGHSTADIAHTQAKAATNLGLQYSEVKELDKALKIYSSIEDLLKQFPTVDIAFSKAKSAATLILNYGDAGDIEQAELLYQDLIALRSIYKTDDISFKQVEAAANLVLDYSVAGMLNHAHKMYQDTITISNEYPTVRIMEQRTRAAANLAIYYYIAGRTDLLQYIYNDINQISLKYYNIEIAINKARTASNIINIYIQLNDLSRASLLANDVAKSFQDYPIADITPTLAKVMYNLIVSCIVARQFKAGESLYQAIISSLNIHSTTDIAVHKAKAAFSLIYGYGQTYQHENALRFLQQELIPLAKARQEAVIWLEVAKSLGFLWELLSSLLTNEIRLEIEDQLISLLDRFDHQVLWQQDEACISLQRIGATIRAGRANSSM